MQLGLYIVVSTWLLSTSSSATAHTHHSMLVMGMALVWYVLVGVFMSGSSQSQQESKNRTLVCCAGDVSQAPVRHLQG